MIMKFFKKIIKFIVGIFLLSKMVRQGLRKFIDSAGFLDAEFKYKLRGFLESVSPEEILKAKLKFLNCKFYYPNKSIVGLAAAEFGYWNDFSILFDIFLKGAKTIVEIGSNIGIDTIFMAKKASSDCKILAFEPTDKYRVILEKNVKENNFKNISIYNYFLSSRSDEEIKIYLNASSASIADNVAKSFPTTGEQNCRSITLDDFSQKIYPLNSLDFLKIDTDGWDQMVVEGGVNMIRKFKPFLLVEFAARCFLNKAGNSSASFAELLYKLGYDNFFLFREKNEPPIYVEGRKKLLDLLDYNGSSDVFAFPESRVVNFKV